MDDLTVLTPGQAAEEMGVSDVTLRRYARAYERVFDDLKPDKGGRLFSGQVLDRLTAAKAMQESGQAVSLEQALLMLREGVEAPTPARVEAGVQDLSEDARGSLATLLRDELRTIIREELAEARRLEGPTAEVEELRRMNAYLKGELERRDEEKAAEVGRPWWKWW